MTSIFATLILRPSGIRGILCYGKKQEWDDREEAQAYFLEAMMNSDGAEHDRYDITSLT